MLLQKYKSISNYFLYILFLVTFFFTPVSLFANNASEINNIKTVYMQKNYDYTIELINDYESKYPNVKNKELLFFIKAESLYQKKQYKQCISIFSEIQKKYPKTKMMAQILFSKACAYFNVLDDFKALNCLRELIVKYPDLPETKEAQFLIAEIYFKTGEYITAIKFYLNTISLYPNSEKSVKAIYKIGCCFYSLGKYDQTVKSMDRILAYKNMEDMKLSALYLKAKSLSFMRRFEEAIIIYNKIINKNVKGVEPCLIEKTSILYKQGRFDETIKELKDFMNKYPDSLYMDNVLYTIALSYFRKKEFILSGKYYDKLINNYKKSILYIDSIINKGICFYNSGEYEQAILNYDIIINNYKDKAVKAYYNKAWALIKLGEEKPAVSIMEDIVLNFSENILSGDIILWLADYYVSKGDEEKAIDSLTSIIDKYKEQPITNDAYFRLSEIYFDLDNIEYGLDCLENIDKNDILYFEAQLSRIKVFIDRAEYDKALLILNKLKKENLEKNIEQEINYYLGQVYFGKKDWKNALKYYSFSEFGQNIELIFKSKVYKGEVLFHMKQWQDALEYFMDIYKKYNPNADREFYYYSMLNSGRCFEKLGEFKSAKLLYKDIKKNTKDKYFIIAGERLRLLKQKIRYLHEAKLIK